MPYGSGKAVAKRKAALNKPTSVAAAKKQGKPTFTGTDGKQKAAVTAKDLKDSGHKTLRAYLNAKGKPAKKSPGKSDSVGKNKREVSAAVAKRTAALKKQNELATMAPKKIDSRAKAQRITDSTPKNIPLSKAQSQQAAEKNKFGFAMPGSKSRINFALNKKK